MDDKLRLLSLEDAPSVVVFLGANAQPVDHMLRLADGDIRAVAVVVAVAVTCCPVLHLDYFGRVRLRRETQVHATLLHKKIITLSDRVLTTETGASI